MFLSHFGLPSDGSKRMYCTKDAQCRHLWSRIPEAAPPPTGVTKEALSCSVTTGDIPETAESRPKTPRPNWARPFLIPSCGPQPPQKPSARPGVMAPPGGVVRRTPAGWRCSRRRSSPLPHWRRRLRASSLPPAFVHRPASRCRRRSGFRRAASSGALPSRAPAHGPPRVAALRTGKALRAPSAGRGCVQPGCGLGFLWLFHFYIIFSPRCRFGVSVVFVVLSPSPFPEGQPASEGRWRVAGFRSAARAPCGADRCGTAALRALVSSGCSQLVPDPALGLYRRVGAEHRKPQYRRTVHTIVFSPDVAECRLGSGFPVSCCFLPPPQFPLDSLSLSHTDPNHTESPNPELHPLWPCRGC